MINGHENPINKTAAMVVQNAPAGSVYKARSKLHLTSKMPITCAIKPKEAVNNSTFKDRTGMKSGWLTVIGWHGGGVKGGRWVVRCVCGNYSVRRGHSIDNDSQEDCCQECADLLHLKRSSYNKRTGKEITRLELMS